MSEKTEVVEISMGQHEHLSGGYKRQGDILISSIPPVQVFSPLFGSGRSQTDVLDQLRLPTPRAFLHVTYISTSPSWTTFAVIGVRRRRTPGLGRPK